MRPLFLMSVMAFVFVTSLTAAAQPKPADPTGSDPKGQGTPDAKSPGVAPAGQETPALPGAAASDAPVCKKFADCPQGQTCLVPKGTCQLAVIDCEQWGGYCAHWKDSCAEGYAGVDPMHCPLGRSGMCCLPAKCAQPSDCGPVRWCYEGTCGPLGNCKSADDCIPQPLEKLTCPGAWKCVEGECEYRCTD